MGTDCVLCEVGTEYVYVAQMNVVLQLQIYITLKSRVVTRYIVRNLRWS